MGAQVRVLLLALTLAFFAAWVQAANFNLNVFSQLTLCASLNGSPDVNNTVAIAGFLPASGFSCTTTKSVTFTGTSISSFTLDFDTTGVVHIQDINFQDSTSVQISNAARLTMTNVQFTRWLFGSAGLEVSNVGQAVLDQCSFSQRKPSVAPVSFDSCGSVVVRDTTFKSNQGNTAGGIRANSVTSLSIIDSTFSFNTGSVAHVLSATSSNVTVSGSSFVSNGNLFATATPLIAVTGGSLVMAASQVSLNWGATLALRGLVAASNVTDSSFDLNFNARQRSLIDVDGCAGGLTIARSTISYNLGGGLSVQDCAVGVTQTKVWAQSSFGVACGNQGSINAPSTSVYKNGWSINLLGASKFVDATCTPGCVGLSLFGGVDACANATTVVNGFNVSCPGGLNKCSQCQASAGCLDCNGLPFGTSSNATCAKWNMLKTSGAQVSYASSTSPTCSLTAVSETTDAITGASMDLFYEAVTVYYFNTSSNAEQALYRFPINDSDYTRSRGNMTNDKFCINYERVLDNGAGLLLQQCLFDVAQSVLFGNETLTVPPDFTKITVSLSSMVSFDNQTRNYTDIDITTRRVAVELSLRMSQAGSMGAVPTNATHLEALRFVGASFDMAMELPNYAIFSDNDTSTFAYSFNASSSSTTNKTAGYQLVLEFTGPFDTVFYDPQFGLLLGSDGKGNGASDDGILLQVLVPVLAGSALLVVVLFAIGFASWFVWKKRQTNRAYRESTSMVSFAENTSHDGL